MVPSIVLLCRQIAQSQPPNMPTHFCKPRRDHQAPAHRNSHGSEQLRTQIPAAVVVNERATDRGPRQRRDADAQEHKRDPDAPLGVVVAREIPDGGVVQALHGAGEEAVEAGDDGDGGVAGGGDPDEEEDGGEEDARDDGVDVAEEAVGEEGGEEAAGEVGCIHEDEEVYGGVAVELEVDLGVCYDEVEAEVYAPEGEEEA